MSCDQLGVESVSHRSRCRKFNIKEACPLCSLRDMARICIFFAFAVISNIKPFHPYYRLLSAD